MPNDRLAHLVKDATRALLRALQMRLTAHDVSLGHWTFLRILWEKDGLTQRELSEQAGVMEPTTFSALNAMEKLGYVVRRQVPDNRKKVYVYLTPKGRLLKEQAGAAGRGGQRVAVAGVPAEHIAATRQTLLAIIENLARDEARRTTPSAAFLRRASLASRAAAKQKRKRA